MKTQLLKDLLIEKGIFVRESSQGKTFLCKCPICGDHKDERKAHHLYISTDKNICHCFLCDYAAPTTTFIKKLTGKQIDPHKYFSKESLDNEEKKRQGIIVKTTTGKRVIRYKLPEIGYDQFLPKREYIKKRSNYKLNPENIPNLIFDIFEFFRINNLKMPEDIYPDYFQSKFVCFLCYNHRYIICRNIDSNDNGIKFKKIILQDDVLEMSDYYCIRGGNPKSNKIIMSEGVFNILGEYSEDSLKIKNDIKLYIACNSFLYTSVLKSVCFDHQLFQPEVIILSDKDKTLHDYSRKFYPKSKHILKNLNIYYNRSGNDFGTFPLLPLNGGDLKDVSTITKNTKSF